MDLSKSRWRKATDVDREHAIFELVVDDMTLLDVGFSDDGILEISFDAGISSTLTSYEEFSLVLARGKQLAEADK